MTLHNPLSTKHYKSQFYIHRGGKWRNYHNLFHFSEFAIHLKSVTWYPNTSSRCRGACKRKGEWWKGVQDRSDGTLRFQTLSRAKVSGAVALWELSPTWTWEREQSKTECFKLLEGLDMPSKVCFPKHLAEIRRCRQSNYHPAQSAWCVFTDKRGLHSAWTNCVWCW